MRLGYRQERSKPIEDAKLESVVAAISREEPKGKRDGKLHVRKRPL